MNKRVVVVLVEGPTDRIALRGNLNHLVNDKTIEFESTNGDITSDESLIANEDLNDVLVQDVRDLIAKQNDFALSDVIEVVHLIDTDGLYIPEERIIQKRLNEEEQIIDENRRPFYNDDSIEVLDVDSERKTLKNKRDSVRDLLEKTTLDFGCGISKLYSIFYNSCNLEHALHNKRNVAANEKRTLAKDFAFQCYQNDKKFITLFDELNKARSWDFSTSWMYLKKSFNSLERGSNFLLYLRKLNKELVDRFSVCTK
jgi:hypothetical protein